MSLITGGKMNAITITMAVIIRHYPHHRHHQRMVSCCADRHIRHLTVIYNEHLRFVYMLLPSLLMPWIPVATNRHCCDHIGA